MDDDTLAEQKKISDKVSYWLAQIGDARKREDTYRKEARKIVDIYEGKHADKTQYNILYSNTDTLAPALYNTTPRPVVQRRYKDEDTIGKAASAVTQRVLEYTLDDGEQEYSTFDDLMRASVLEGLVPGRGLTRFKFEADVKGEEGAEEVSGEKVCGEEIPWDRFIHGFGKKWNQVPWQGVEHHMTKEELVKNFGIEAAEKVNMADTEVGADDNDEQKSDATGEEANSKLSCVYEIWSKLDRKVYFLCAGLPEEFLKVVDDPLKLAGFYPWPKPLSFVQKISTLVPVPLYRMYEDQAKELNLITVRLNKLIAACRVRGMFNTQVEGIADALKAEDNVLTPAANVAALGNIGAALEQAIWLFPIDKVIGVIQQLYVARQQIKSVIFEITGIADIMRGSSQASETLGAQEIKNQWGTLRLKRVQKEVQRYVRDCLRIVAELSVTKLPQDTIRAMTGLPYPTQAEKQQAQQQLQQMQQEAAMMAQQAQASGQPPQQPPPPPPELTKILELPAWEDILKGLKNDITRSYRIDIETNSTVDAEATEDKQNISELLNAMAQFLNGVAPLIEQGIMPFEAAKTMLMTIARRFRFGTDVEDALKMMAAPQPKADPKAEVEKAKMAIEQQRAQQDMKMKEMDMQQKQAEMQFQASQKQQDAALAQQKHQMEMAAMTMEMQLKQKEFEFKMAELEMKAAVQKASAEANMQNTMMTAATNAQAGQIKNQQLQQGAQIKDKQAKDAAALKEKQMKQAAAAPKPGQK
jgi:hypothetical protein